MFSFKKKEETGHMSDSGSGEGSLLTRLNQPLFKKKEGLADEEYMLDSELQASQVASTKNKSITSLFSTKKGKGGKNAGQPYTMFSKPIKGNLLAVDFDDYDLTLVVAKQKRKELEIVKTVKASLPVGLVHDGLIINMDALIEFIDHLMKENDIVAKYAFLQSIIQVSLRVQLWYQMPLQKKTSKTLSPLSCSSTWTSIQVLISLIINSVRNQMAV